MLGNSGPQQEPTCPDGIPGCPKTSARARISRPDSRGLAHAVDPRFEAFGAIEYGQPKCNHRTRDYELIAESAAMNAFFSFNLHPYRDSEYLTSTVGKRWRKKLTGPDRGARILVTSSILRKPLPQDTRE